MNLNDDDKLIYLANLIAVSRADGSISPNETHAIEAAKERIRARKDVLKKNLSQKKRRRMIEQASSKNAKKLSA